MISSRARRSALLGLVSALVAMAAAPAGGPAAAAPPPAGGAAVAAAAPAVAPTDWPAFLHDARHTSQAATATAITPANAATLRRAWRFAPTVTGGPAPISAFWASPTVVGGVVYIGANNGRFYALDLATGAVRWQRLLGFAPALTCSGIGIVSTATVAPDPVSGALTVYVGSPDGYLYTLDAATGALRWRAVINLPSPTANDYFAWTSPTIANGVIYMGSASNCDIPLTRGSVKSYDQATGQLIATWFTVAAGVGGGGVWSTPAIDPIDGSVFVTTGTQPATGPAYASVSIVRLAARTLTVLGRWTIPPAERASDGDFGASPVMFNGLVAGQPTALVAACNKNGLLYAWKRFALGAGPVWKVRIGATAAATGVAMCISSPIWDGRLLYQGGDATTVGGVAFAGSVRAINPSTGAFVWERGLPKTVLGSPALNGSGVIAASTYTTPGNESVAPATYLLDRQTGAILATLASGSTAFAQPVFTGGMVLTATLGGLQAFTLP